MYFSRTLILNLLLFLSFIGLAVHAESQDEKKETVTVVETTTAEAKEEAAKKLELVAILTSEWFSERQKLFSEQNTALTQDHTAQQTKLVELRKNLDELTAKEKTRADQAEKMIGRTVIAAASDTKKEESLVSEEMLKRASEERSLLNDEIEKIRLDRQIAQKLSQQLQQELEDQEKVLKSLVATAASESPPDKTPKIDTSAAPTPATDKTVPIQTNQPSNLTDNSKNTSSANAANPAKVMEKTSAQAESGYVPPSAPVESMATPKSTEPVDDAEQKAKKAATQQTNKLFELDSKIALLKQAIDLLKRYLEVVNQRYELNNQYVKAVIQWNDALYVIHQSYLLRAKEDIINESRATLKRNQDALRFDQEDLPNKVNRLETSKIAIDVLEDMLDKAALDKETSAIEADNFKLENQSMEANLKKQQGHIEKQSQELEKLRKTPFAEPAEVEVQKVMIVEFENRIALLNRNVKLMQQEIELVKQRIEFRKKQSQLATAWYDKLQVVYHLRQQQFLEEKVQKEQQEHLSRALELRKQLESLPETSSSVQRYLLKVQIQEANERAQQVVRELQIRHIEEQINDGYKLIEQKTADVYQKLDNLQSLVSMVDKLALETKQIQEILQNKIQVFTQQSTVVKKRGESLTNEWTESNQQTQQLLEKIVNSLQQEANSLPPLLGKGKDLLALLEVAYKDTLQQALFRLRKLPTDIAGWLALFKEEIAVVPHLFLQQSILSWQGIVQAVQQTTSKNWLIILAVTFGWLIGLSQMIRWAKTHVLDEHSPSFIGQSFFLGLRLLQHNVLTIMFIGILLILIWFTNPTAASTVFILTLLLGWLSIQLLFSLIQMLLHNEDMKKLMTAAMRWQLQGILLIIGILSIITVLVHIEQDGYILKVSLTARDVIDTLFMVLLSLLIFPLLRIRRVILNVWKNDISGYNSLMLNLVTLLIPLIILATSILGLIGYISLGWSFAKHLSLFLMVSVTTFILEGLVTDIIKVWQQAISKDSSYSLLWAESIIPLIHKLLSLATLALGVIIFLWVTGWYSDVAMRKTIVSIFNYSLFMMGDNSITISDILLAGFTLWIVFWLGGWSRQVTYQFAYQAIVDLGVRQSLSTFTQYTVIFIGILIAMSIIGINLTTLTVFAGAIGVGIGFGLRDLINNFISGILLLVERPLRNGDFIEVGTNQGRVKQIGIRSLTMRAIDGRDVIVPNSEVISHTFVNWTLSDKLRRTTISVNLSYHENPHLVKEVLLKLTEACPEILKTPAPSVLLSEFTDYSMKISLNYFIDMSQAIAPIVKSKVLFLIWERFKEAGIQIPYPQQDVHLKTDSLEPSLLSNEAPHL